MNSRWSPAFSFLIIIVVTSMLSSFSSGPIERKLEGRTMGTTYHITYFDPQERNLQSSVDSLLILINKSISTYDTASEISQFNRNKNSLTYKLPYFYPPLRKSGEVFKETSGAFDPTVMPFVNAWGFGPKKIDRPDTSEVIAAREFVGFEKINFNKDSIWKKDPRVQLDFSAIGQGYGADVIADFFKSKGIVNFFIELGGEGVAWGRNLLKGRKWEIGVLDPNPDFMESKFIAFVTLKDGGFTTSGNYYNYREVNGKRYSHTIDPVSGFPVQNQLLSATVFAPDCATADAWATGIMSMGHSNAIKILKNHPELNVFLVYTNVNTKEIYVSRSIRNNVEIQH